ncbi:MAG: diguanylate cyclase [Burkholderiales bacterium]|nr:diguanylate cyclase [Burkholderiales bacterium]
MLLPLLYYAAAQLGSLLTTSADGMAIIWAPNAVLLAALLYYDSHRKYALLGLCLAAEVAADITTFPWPIGLLLGTVNLTEVMIAYGVLRYLHFGKQLNSLDDLGRFILGGPGLAALAGGLLGATVLTSLHLSHTGFAGLFRIWWFGDALGQLLITPLCLLAAQMDRRGKASLTHTDLIMAIYAIAIALLLGFAKGGTVAGVLVTPALWLPALFYVGARFEPVWSALGCSAMSFGIASLIVLHRQPFGALSVNEEIMRGQEMILILTLFCFGFAALKHQIRAHERDLEVRVAERTRELEQLNNVLVRAAQTDLLTGLYNRRAFYETAHLEFDRCLRHALPLVILMADLDYFKSINDRHGHMVGDQALRHVAEILGIMTRDSDTVARYGGEEFILIAPETDLSEGRILAERLGEALRNTPMHIDDELIQITASIGITEFRPGDSLETLIARADAALYSAKSGGRDRIVQA